MTDQVASVTPVVGSVSIADLRSCLMLGWRDFRQAPAMGLVLASTCVIGGWLIVWALTARGAIWWTLPAAAGFPILAPFLGCGYYEISRRIEAGEALDWRGVFGAVLRQKDRQIPSMAAVIAVFFLFWNFLAHMIFALFLGLSTMTNVTSSFAVFLTREGMMMLSVGTLVGAVFAATLFALTVVSLPMLLDREVDFVTAMITSVSVVLNNPVVMGVWAAIIAGAVFVAMLPWFLGLFLALPVLGHATWHLYRRALQ